LLTPSWCSKALLSRSTAFTAAHYLPRHYYTAQVLKTGLGTDAAGRIDAYEFLQCVEDIASQQEWYSEDATTAAATAAGGGTCSASTLDAIAASAAHLSNSSSSWGVSGGVYNTTSSSSPLHYQQQQQQYAHTGTSNSAGNDGGADAYLTGTLFTGESHLDPVRSAQQVLSEAAEQLALIDLSTLSAGFGCTLAEGVGAPFRRRDVRGSGLLPPRELACALEDLGIVLKPGEVHTLALHFRPGSTTTNASTAAAAAAATAGAGTVGSSRGAAAAAAAATAASVRAALAASSKTAKKQSAAAVTQAEYAPLVRWLVEAICRDRGLDPATAATASLGARGKWYERLASVAERLKRAVAAAAASAGGGRTAWLATLRQRFDDFDLDSSGSLGRREFLRVLQLAGMELSEPEASALLQHLDRDSDGAVSWEEFIEFFASDTTASAATVGDGSNQSAGREPFFALECELADRLLKHMEAQGGAAARRGWLGSLRRAFALADADASGGLDRRELRRCLASLGLTFTAEEHDR
jgi:Ca2+-binding EF-hand superfamily protein